VGFVEHAVYDRISEGTAIQYHSLKIGDQPPQPSTKTLIGNIISPHTPPSASEITQAIVNDPNKGLRDTLNLQVLTENKTLKSITRLITSTSAGGIENIPFVTTNATAASLDSLFSIEPVVMKTARTFCNCSIRKPACSISAASAFRMLQSGHW
jgi:hypothetical protein